MSEISLVCHKNGYVMRNTFSMTGNYSDLLLWNYRSWSLLLPLVFGWSMRELCRILSIINGLLEGPILKTDLQKVSLKINLVTNALNNVSTANWVHIWWIQEGASPSCHWKCHTLIISKKEYINLQEYVLIFSAIKKSFVLMTYNKLMREKRKYVPLHLWPDIPCLRQTILLTSSLL